MSIAFVMTIFCLSLMMPFERLPQGFYDVPFFSHINKITSRLGMDVHAFNLST